MKVYDLSVQYPVAIPSVANGSNTAVPDDAVELVDVIVRTPVALLYVGASEDNADQSNPVFPNVTDVHIRGALSVSQTDGVFDDSSVNSDSIVMADELVLAHVVCTMTSFILYCVVFRMYTLYVPDTVAPLQADE